jgi:hypothetical protein
VGGGISPALAGFEVFQHPNGVALDYSVDSLRGLEAQALLLFNRPDDVIDGPDSPVVRAIMAYVGLTLLHLTGGSWDWDDQPGFAQRAHPALADAALIEKVARGYWGWDEPPADTPPGIPIATPGPNLGLDPVSPLHLLLATVIDRPTGDGPLVHTYNTWRQKISTPPPRGVPGIDVFHRPEPSAVLDAWLATREQDFPAWATRYPGRWDFSPESIDKLTDLLRRTTPTLEAFNDPANYDFTEGACWYLGEMFRRANPTLWQWVYRDYAAEPGDPDLIGYAVQRSDDTDFKTPFRLLRACLKTGQSSARTAYDRWARLPRPPTANGWSVA